MLDKLLASCVLLMGCHHTFIDLSEDGGGDYPPPPVCSAWEQPNADTTPFHAQDLLWIGDEDPYVHDGGLAITDRAAFYIQSGYWKRTLATYSVTIPPVAMLPLDTCGRHGWHVGTVYFYTDYDGVIRRYVGNGIISWYPGSTLSVEEEEVCDPMTGEGWKEYRVNGAVAQRIENHGCDPVVLSVLYFLPGYRMDCETNDPVEPAGPVYVEEPMVLRDFCFVAEDWE